MMAAIGLVGYSRLGLEDVNDCLRVFGSCDKKTLKYKVLDQCAIRANGVKRGIKLKDEMIMVGLKTREVWWLKCC
jgi:hypothetical protein